MTALEGRSSEAPGRTAVVQGASGAIGAALVGALLHRSGIDRVVATGRSLHRLEATFAPLSGHSGRLSLVMVA